MRQQEECRMFFFLWFGGGNHALIPKEIKKAVAEKPENVIFAGFMPPVILRDAYCGADAFAFFSYEETEGIVVLEALSCEIPVIVRDIPVYEKWLEDGVQVRKATDPFSYEQALLRDSVRGTRGRDTVQNPSWQSFGGGTQHESNRGKLYQIQQSLYP